MQGDGLCRCESSTEFYRSRACAQQRRLPQRSREASSRMRDCTCRLEGRLNNAQHTLSTSRLDNHLYSCINRPPVPTRAPTRAMNACRHLNRAGSAPAVSHVRHRLVVTPRPSARHDLAIRAFATASAPSKQTVSWTQRRQQRSVDLGVSMSASTPKMRCVQMWDKCRTIASRV